MNINEKEQINEIINEVVDTINQYESLNSHWLQTCLHDKEYNLLVGALIPLASLQTINEKLQKLWVNS
tara:strand:- start:893 stop:1096 length:204 start_codon:yes stop_codon:yes gene_type:complete